MEPVGRDPTTTAVLLLTGIDYDYGRTPKIYLLHIAWTSPQIFCACYSQAFEKVSCAGSGIFWLAWTNLMHCILVLCIDM